jgi:hypothetical protein
MQCPADRCVRSELAVLADDELKRLGSHWRPWVVRCLAWVSNAYHFRGTPR